MCVRSWGEGSLPLPTGSGHPPGGCDLDARGLRRSVRLQAPDDVGNVGELLLEVSLMLLEPRQPLVAVAEAPVAAPMCAVFARAAHVISLLSRSVEGTRRCVRGSFRGRP